MTDRIAHRPLFRLAAPALAWVFLGIPLGGCDQDHLAGTSVGTGNPQVVTLGFREGAVAARVTGEVALYAADHNPLVDSLPLASFRLEDQDSLELLQESLWPHQGGSGAPADTEFTLNALLRTGDGRGAWLAGMAFALRSGRVHSLHPLPRIDLSVVTLDSFQGSVAGEAVPAEKSYVTVFGSPFLGQVFDCGFSLDSIPRGRYEARLVRLVKDAPTRGDWALVPVHALGDSLDTRGTPPLAPGTSAIDTVPVPRKRLEESP